MSGEPSTTSITPVGEIMSEQLETISFSNTAQESAIKMSDRNVSSLIVLGDNGIHEDKEKQVGKQKDCWTKDPHKKKEQAHCPTK